MSVTGHLSDIIRWKRNADIFHAETGNVILLLQSRCELHIGWLHTINGQDRTGLVESADYWTHGLLWFFHTTRPIDSLDMLKVMRVVVAALTALLSVHTTDSQLQLFEICLLFMQE